MHTGWGRRTSPRITGLVSAHGSRTTGPTNKTQKNNKKNAKWFHFDDEQALARMPVFPEQAESIQTVPTHGSCMHMIK